MCILWPWPRTLKVLSNKTIVQLFNYIPCGPRTTYGECASSQNFHNNLACERNSAITHTTRKSYARLRPIQKVGSWKSPLGAMESIGPVRAHKYALCVHSHLVGGGGAGNSWIVVVSPKTQPNQPNQKPPNNFDNFKLLWKTANQLGMFVCVFLCMTHARESSRVYILIAQTLPRKRTHQTVHIWPTISTVHHPTPHSLYSWQIQKRTNATMLHSQIFAHVPHPCPPNGGIYHAVMQNNHTHKQTTFMYRRKHIQQHTKKHPTKYTFRLLRFAECNIRTNQTGHTLQSIHIESKKSLSSIFVSNLCESAPGRCSARAASITSMYSGAPPARTHTHRTKREMCGATARTLEFPFKLKWIELCRDQVHERDVRPDRTSVRSFCAYSAAPAATAQPLWFVCALNACARPPHLPPRWARRRQSLHLLCPPV